MKGLIVGVLIIFAIGVFSIRTMKSVSLRQNCTGYLKRAADANSVESAREQLQRSIKYLEENNLTSGYTSVLWQTPDEDIQFWYKNLKTSEVELAKVDSTTPSVDKTNLLMKLRETLLDNGKDGDSLTVPDGLSRYPNNGMWGVLTILATLIILGIIGWIHVIIEP